MDDEKVNLVKDNVAEIIYKDVESKIYEKYFVNFKGTVNSFPEKRVNFAMLPDTLSNAKKEVFGLEFDDIFQGMIAKKFKELAWINIKEDDINIYVNTRESEFKRLFDVIGISKNYILSKCINESLFDLSTTIFNLKSDLENYIQMLHEKNQESIASVRRNLLSSEYKGILIIDQSKGLKNIFKKSIPEEEQISKQLLNHLNEAMYIPLTEVLKSTILISVLGNIEEICEALLDEVNFFSAKDIEDSVKSYDEEVNSLIQTKLSSTGYSRKFYEYWKHNLSSNSFDNFEDLVLESVSSVTDKLDISKEFIPFLVEQPEGNRQQVTNIISKIKSELTNTNIKPVRLNGRQGVSWNKYSDNKSILYLNSEFRELAIKKYGNIFNATNYKDSPNGEVFTESTIDKFDLDDLFIFKGGMD